MNGHSRLLLALIDGILGRLVHAMDLSLLLLVCRENSAIIGAKMKNLDSNVQ